MIRLSERQIAHVKALEDSRGGLTPDVVLADAKKKTSPLHSLIDWDRDKAARAWWLECAREIIRAVQIVVTTSEAVIKAPYYTHDPAAAGQGYRSIVALQRDPESARQALIEELTRAAGVLARARNLGAALHLEKEIDTMIERLTGLRRRAERIAA